jgi:hypothetical protein
VEFNVVDARRVIRRPTCWVAQLRAADDVTVGSVLDISAHGAFFCPEREDGIIELFRVGQPVALAFESEPNLAGLDLPCRVRWIGFSAAHGRTGFGVEFVGGPIAT